MKIECIVCEAHAHMPLRFFGTTKNVEQCFCVPALRRVCARCVGTVWYGFQQIDSCDRSIFWFYYIISFSLFFFFIFTHIIHSFLCKRVQYHHTFVFNTDHIERGSFLFFLRTFSFFSLSFSLFPSCPHRTPFACCFIEFNATMFVVFHDNAQYPKYVFFLAASHPCVLKMKRKIGKSTCAPHSARDDDIFPVAPDIGHTRISLPRKLWRAFVTFVCMRFTRNGHKREIFVLFSFSFFFVDVRWPLLDSILGSWPKVPPHHRCIYNSAIFQQPSNNKNNPYSSKWDSLTDGRTDGRCVCEREI